MGAQLLFLDAYICTHKRVFENSLLHTVFCSLLELLGSLVDVYTIGVLDYDSDKSADVLRHWLSLST